MTTKQVIHIFGRTPHHYLPMKSFLQKVGVEFDIHQELWAWSDGTTEQPDILYYKDGKALLTLLSATSKHTCFVFHGLFDRSIWPFLAVSSVLKRAAWVCWGAEVYQHKLQNRTWKMRVAKVFQKIMVKRFRSVFSLNCGDGKEIRQMLWDRDTDVLPYPLIGSNAKPNPCSDDKPFTVLLGNSASIYNNHIEALDWLAHLSNSNIQIVCPLNYAGPEEYVAKVKAHGKRIFSDKFLPITDMLDKNEYDELLASADSAVFAHQRQQGLYVVYSLLKHGKKMFLRGSTSSFKDLAAQGFTVFDSESIATMDMSDFLHLDSQEMQNNARLMKETFSEEALIPKWGEQLKQLMAA